MPYAFVFYTDPLDAHATLKPDSGGAIEAIPYSDATGRAGHLCTVADGVPSEHGAELNLDAPAHMPSRVRGFLLLKDGVGRLQVDDFTLNPVPVAPETPPPTTGGDPFAIITSVYNTGQFNLATHDGCGQFTEACLAALMAQASPMWGHILKTPGQNQYQGHAVDALMLLAGPGNGIFDIIQNSVSPEAKPQYIRQGDPDPDLWYQPTSLTGFSLVARPTKQVHHAGPHPVH